MANVIENWQQMAVNRRKKVTEPKIPHVSELLADRQWAGCPGVVLGGGPSLGPLIERLDEFPPATHFIGVNQSWRLKAEVVYAIDAQVFDLAESSYKEEWERRAAEGQVRITHRTNSTKGRWRGASWVGQIANEAWGTTFAKGVIAANNSGLCALNVADILGLDPIILLGFDGWKAGRPQNWHEDYPEKQGFRPKNPQKTCERWEVNFRSIAKKIQAKVYNALPQSAYRSFPRIEFDEAIRICNEAASHNPGFVIGGGPSLRGFDFDRLRGRRCLAVNAAFKEVPWAEIAYVGDVRLLDLLVDDDDWINFAGKRYSRAEKLAGTTKLQSVSITGLVTTPRWTQQKGKVVSLSNAGIAAVNLAEQFGWNPIFLLGFDCAGYDKRGRMGNYHEHYPQQWAKPGPYLTFKFKRSWSLVVEDIKARVYNCNPNSKLDYFDKITFEEALALC